MGSHGYIHGYTGNGKGKTTAAVGLSVRAAGNGLRVLFCQFLKDTPTGELTSLQKLGIEVRRAGKVEGFTFSMTPEELGACRESHLAFLQEVQQAVKEAHYDLLVLDEAICAVSCGILEEKAVLQFLKNKPDSLEVVLTGRGISEKIAQCCDYLSEIAEKKHPYRQGIPARRGIEY